MDIRKMVKTSILGLAAARGYEMIPYWKLHDAPLVRHLRELFRHYEIRVVIDVGANLGQYHDLLRQDVGFEGRILSFEPVRGFYDKLAARQAADPGWSIYPCALGSAAGAAQINVARSPGLHSFLAARTDVVEGYWDEGALLGVETVQLRTLDEVLAEAGIDCAAASTYLKLDTQGFDLEVIKGARAALPAIRALQTEASVRPIYHGMPGYEETFATLRGHRFDLSGMFPVTQDSALRLVEFDAVFVNNRNA